MTINFQLSHILGQLTFLLYLQHLFYKIYLLKILFSVVRRYRTTDFFLLNFVSKAFQLFTCGFGFSITLSPIHHFTNPPLHQSTTSPIYQSTISQLYQSTTSPIHGFFLLIFTIIPSKAPGNVCVKILSSFSKPLITTVSAPK